MNTRVISAIVAIPILIFFTIVGGNIFKVGVMALTAIALFEYISAYKRTNNKVITPVIILIYCLNFIFVFLDYTFELNLSIIIFATLLSMAVPIFDKKYNVMSSALTVIGILYIIVFFDTLIQIRNSNFGSKFIWLTYIVPWACDTFAYYTGRYFGKHKLCPDVSPKKTIEGSIGGILGSIVGSIIWLILNRETNISILSILFLAIIGGVISQIGDLSASLIKRHVGIKDYGNIMPGHGGVLDRFDSILFVAPLVYYYIEIMRF
ncbi:MAG: phosphatidate cytidylyltransferase [Caloramator sp.]|nr:phosphatidate cytidylyltransferase [Caloramator sp.]